MNSAESASEASSVKQANELAMRVNEGTDKRVAQHLRLYSCLFQTTVHFQALSIPKLSQWLMATFDCPSMSDFYICLSALFIGLIY